MKISTKWIKRVFALSLVVLLSIKSFGAVINDNDGAAFVTKEEFEEIKGGLNKKVDIIDTSINGLIGEKIFDYVNGIKISDPPKVYFDQIKDTTNHNPMWRNAGTNPGTLSPATDISVIKNKNYSLQIQNNDDYQAAHFQWQLDDTTKAENAQLIFGLTTDSTFTDDSKIKWLYWGTVEITSPLVEVFGKPGDAIRAFIWHLDGRGWNETGINDPYGQKPQWDSQKSTGRTKWPPFTIKIGEWKQIYSNQTSSNGTFVCLFYAPDIRKDGYIIYGTMGTRKGTQRTWSDNGTSGAGYKLPVDLNDKYKDPGKVDDVNLVFNSTNGVSASSPLWKFRSFGANSRTLVTYLSDCKLRQELILNYKTYMDHSDIAPDALSDNDYSDTTVGTYSPDNTATYGRTTYGENKTSYSEDNQVGYLEQNINWIESTNDTRDYSAMQWGTGTDINIYCLENQPTITKGSRISSTVTDFAEVSNYNIAGKKHKISKVTNTVAQINANNVETYKLNTFENQYYTNIAGEKVYMGYGVPIMFTSASSSEDSIYKIDLTAKLTDLNNAVKEEDIKVMISKNHFVNGAFADATNDSIVDTTITSNSSGIATTTLSIEGIKANQLLWLNMYGSTNDRIVELTDFKVTME